LTGARAWWEREERGSILGMRIVVWFLRHLGWAVARLVLYPIVAYFFLTGGSRRRASLEYLRRLHASPEGAGVFRSTPGQGQVFRHFLEFAFAILDRVGIWVGRSGDFDFEIIGAEELKRVVADGRGALVLGSHLGSFDAMRLVAADRAPIAVNVLMFTRNAVRINDMLDRLGGDSGMKARIIQVEPGSFQHVLQVKACIERGEVVAILADRFHPNEAGRVVRVDFLGGRAPLPQGPILLAGLLGCPLLMMVGLRRSDRAYEIHVERLADRVVLPREDRITAITEWCQLYADRLATYCARAPYQWFNFYDFWDEVGSDARS
jgi:predicted LPLAT superfamily acyltransferase